MSKHVRLGIDLGGTKTEIIALTSDGDTLLRRRTPTPQGDYLSTIQNIVSLVNQAEAELEHKGSVGIAMPGAESPATGLIKNANSTWLNGKSFAQDLSEALQRPIKLTNDANCFALSEAIDGAAQGAAIVFGVILGTGVGGGIVINQQTLTGINAISGEWGHNPLPWPQAGELPGPPCYCGKYGCIETFLSGPALAQDYQGEDNLNGLEIAERAEQGEAAAQDCLQRYVDRLARGLANVINILDPDVVVLGGGVSNIEKLYEAAPSQWDKYVFSDRVDTRLVKAKYGDSSGVRGAAWLWAPGEDAHIV
ncbi:MAG: ROK family protein [Pseudomonadota bacterium]